MKAFLLTILLSAAAGAEPPPIAKGEWAPRDTCGAVEGAAQFREGLAAAVAARDADALIALAADDIELDFGGGAGTAELRARLAASPELWEDLDKLMPLGCAANDQGGVSIPWYFEQDIGNLDVFEAWLVTAEDVPVLRSADRKADRITTLSWDFVEILNFDPEIEYQPVKLPDGTLGYIATGKLRSLIDYRLIASGRNGRWRITAFIAGD
jgi:hypothetical protein